MATMHDTVAVEEVDGGPAAAAALAVSAAIANGGTEGVLLSPPCPFSVSLLPLVFVHGC